MLIRKFKPGEELSLHAIFFSAIHDTASRDYTPEQIEAWAPAEFSEADWVGRTENIQPYVVEHEAELIAYADVQASGLIDHFYVAAAWSQRGVGSMLMRHLHSVAQKQGIKKLFSNVSLTAEPFFRKFGFEVEQRQTVVRHGVQIPNARMVNRLLDKQ